MGRAWGSHWGEARPLVPRRPPEVAIEGGRALGDGAWVNAGAGEHFSRSVVGAPGWRFVLRKFTSWGSRSSYLLAEAIIPLGRPSPHVQGTSTVPALCQELGTLYPPPLSCWTEHLQVVFTVAQGVGQGWGT